MVGTSTVLPDDLKDVVDQKYSCILCQEDLGTRREIVRPHFLSRHGVELPTFERLRNVEGLLTCLQGLVFLPEDEATHHDNSTNVNNGDAVAGESGAASSRAAEAALHDDHVKWHCPVCGVNTGVDCEALELHVAASSHQQWNRHTIEILAAYYRMPAGGVSSDSDGDERDEVMCGDENEGEWDEELPMKCLYCSYQGVDCLEHMITVHHFDLKRETSSRGDIRDEYDLIRVVNDVRRNVSVGRCPCFRVDNPSDEGNCSFESSEQRSADYWPALEEHLLQNASHRLPHRFSQGDEALLPVLPNDALLSHLMTAGEGFLSQETQDPDFPMVPTLLQLAERRRMNATKPPGS